MGYNGIHLKQRKTKSVVKDGITDPKPMRDEYCLINISENKELVVSEM